MDQSKLNMGEYILRFICYYFTHHVHSFPLHATRYLFYWKLISVSWLRKEMIFCFCQMFYKFIMIDEQSNSRMGTEKSETLKAVYDKVQQIKNQQGISMATQRQILKNKISMVHQTNLLLAINRSEEFQKRRTSYSSNLLQTKKAFRFRKSLSSEKKPRLSECMTKSERINNFLQLTKSKSMITADQKEEVQKVQQKALRSRIQFQQDKTHEKKQIQQKQVKMLAKNYLRSSYSQKARLSAVSDMNSSKKYLRKGYRIRQTLIKQLVKEGLDEVEQLGYMKQYNQLIPKILIQDKKMELSHLMRILKGQKLNLKHKNKFI